MSGEIPKNPNKEPLSEIHVTGGVWNPYDEEAIQETGLLGIYIVQDSQSKDKRSIYELSENKVVTLKTQLSMDTRSGDFFIPPYEPLPPWQIGINGQIYEIKEEESKKIQHGLKYETGANLMFEQAKHQLKQRKRKK